MNRYRDAIAQTLNGQFYQMMESYTNISMGSFVDVVRLGFIDAGDIGYVSYMSRFLISDFKRARRRPFATSPGGWAVLRSEIAKFKRKTALALGKLPGSS